MIFAISGYGLTGRCVGRSKALDDNGRRCYLILCGGDVYEVSEDLLREAT